jgi:hypothetical protein
MARMLAWRQHRRTGGHRLASRSHDWRCDRLLTGCASSMEWNGRDSRRCKSRDGGRDGDRARLACSESARHLCDAGAEHSVVIQGCCRPCLWGVVRSALHIGRCEGDAMGHQRDEDRIAPGEINVNLIGLLRRCLLLCAEECDKVLNRLHATIHRIASRVPCGPTCPACDIGEDVEVDIVGIQSQILDQAVCCAHGKIGLHPPAVVAGLVHTRRG